MKKCEKCKKELPPSILHSILASSTCHECETNDAKRDSYQPHANADKANRMNNKQIIGIIVLIFVLLVGYKVISSNIQAGKEKDVLQEKFNLSELAKKPLEICLKKAEDESVYNPSLDNIMRNPVAMEYGLALQAKKACSFILDEADNNTCWLDHIFNSQLTREEKQMRFVVMMKRIEAQIASYEKTKEECYKQYK